MGTREATPTCAKTSHATVRSEGFFDTALRDNDVQAGTALCWPPACNKGEGSQESAFHHSAPHTQSSESGWRPGSRRRQPSDCKLCCIEADRADCAWTTKYRYIGGNSTWNNINHNKNNNNRTAPFNELAASPMCRCAKVPLAIAASKAGEAVSPRAGHEHALSFHSPDFRMQYHAIRSSAKAVEGVAYHAAVSNM